MAHLIVIDGPRGSGSMQVAQNVMDKLEKSGYTVEGRWSVYEPDVSDSRYLNFIVEDGVAEADFFIWQGSWVSDYVWAKLKYGGRMASQPELAEWFYGRWFCSKHVVLGPGGQRQENQVSVRDKDVEVNVSTERRLYRNYGRLNGWEVHQNGYTAASIEDTTNMIIDHTIGSVIPKGMFNSANPEVVVMEKNNFNVTNFPVPFITMNHHPALMEMFANKRVLWVVADKSVNLDYLNESFCPVICMDEDSERLANMVLDDPSRALRIAVPLVAPSADYLAIVREYWENVQAAVEKEQEKNVAELVNDEDLFANDQNDSDTPPDDDDLELDVDIEGEER